MRARHLALPAAILCLTFAACDDDDPRSPGAGTPRVAGAGVAGPSLEGFWLVTSTPVNNSCGAIDARLETVTVLTLVQAGSDFDFTMRDDCGTLIPGGTGRVDPSGAVSFDTVTVEPLDATCTLRVTQSFTGFARTPTDVFNGTSSVNVAASTLQGQNDCGTALPCTVTASFRAVRCPATGCQVTCTP